MFPNTKTFLFMYENAMLEPIPDKKNKNEFNVSICSNKHIVVSQFDFHLFIFFLIAK